MTIYRGSYFSVTLTLQGNDGEPTDITGWEFRSQIRDNPSDEEYMIELTTANGGIEVVDGPAGQLKLIITADQNKDFSLGKVHGDVFRTDAPEGPIRLFGFTDQVRRSITRDE